LEHENLQHPRCLYAVLGVGMVLFPHGSVSTSPDMRFVAFPGVEYDSQLRFVRVYFSKVPASATSPTPPPWPSVPPWSVAQQAPVPAPAADGDRASRERAVLSLMFGRIRSRRIPVDADNRKEWHRSLDADGREKWWGTQAR
jgi:hypothetical protein